MGIVTDATTADEVPVVIVVQTFAFDTEALSCERVPLFVLVVAVLHFVVARTVEVTVIGFSVDKLARWTHD